MYRDRITTELTNDHNREWLYFIDGVHYCQPGFKTSKEAFAAGLKKIKELKRSRKKYGK